MLLYSSLTLTVPSGVAILWTPHFYGYYAFLTKKARLVFLFKTKKPFLENGLELLLIFVFLF